MSQDNFVQPLLNVVNDYLYRGYQRGLAPGQIITHHCDNPFKSVTINLNGDCLLCICDAWLPISVGNILTFDNLLDIWNNPSAKILQKTITDHEYTHCAVSSCDIDKEPILRTTHYYINISIDDSCNLACPTCRREARNYTNGEIFDRKLKQINHLVELLNNFEQALEIVLTGNGDPLASSIMRPLIQNWLPKQNQNIILFTNGLLLKKLMPESSIFPYVHRFQISVDAGSAEVYEKVRAPGKFANLIENLNWLHQNVSKETDVVLKFVLSSLNVNDIENFSNLCKHYGFQGEIHKLDDWATFDNFKDFDVVGNHTHAFHNIAVEQLQKVSTHSHLTFGATLKDFL
jgi:MoaA/NifB/PqqE/SkfB family radical SAM enzyme